MKKLHHLCIQTDCYEDSLSFYTNILGFELIKESSDFHNRDFNSWLKQDEMMIELQTNKMDEVLVDYNKKSKGIVHFCILVENIDDEYSKIKEHSFENFKTKNEEEIYTVENGKLFKLIAPEGTIIEIRDQAGL